MAFDRASHPIVEIEIYNLLRDNNQFGLKIRNEIFHPLYNININEDRLTCRELYQITRKIVSNEVKRLKGLNYRVRWLNHLHFRDTLGNVISFKKHLKDMRGLNFS